MSRARGRGRHHQDIPGRAAWHRRPKRWGRRASGLRRVKTGWLVTGARGRNVFDPRPRTGKHTSAGQRRRAALIAAVGRKR